MSASEKLEALNNGHERVIPIFRKVAVDEGGVGFARARDVEAVMDALPQIVVVMSAVESCRSDWQMKAELADALDELDKALSWLERVVGALPEGEIE